MKGYEERDIKNAIQSMARSLKRIADALEEEEPDDVTTEAVAEIEELLSHPQLEPVYDRDKLKEFVERHDE